MGIAKISKIAGGLLAAGIALIVGSGWLALRELRVNGPIYQKISSGKDLITNVVPPSVYIIEAFLEATVISREPWTLEPGRRRLKNLRRQYEERHAYWSRQELPLALRDQLLIAAHKPAEDFWQTLEGSFLTAMDQENAEFVGSAYLQLAEFFQTHRSAIDDVVKLARQHNSELERSAAVRKAQSFSALPASLHLSSHLLQSA